MYFLLKMVIFQRYVSLPEGKFVHLEFSLKSMGSDQNEPDSQLAVYFDHCSDVVFSRTRSWSPRQADFVDCPAQHNMLRVSIWSSLKLFRIWWSGQSIGDHLSIIIPIWAHHPEWPPHQEIRPYFHRWKVWLWGGASLDLHDTWCFFCKMADSQGCTTLLELLQGSMSLTVAHMLLSKKRGSSCNKLTSKNPPFFRLFSCQFSTL